MKILFFVDILDTGGKERRLAELMKAYVGIQDIEFELVVMSHEIDFRELFDLGIKIHYILRKTHKDVLVFYWFYKLCLKFKPDIVHCWDSMTAVYSVPACKMLNIKLVNGMVSNSPLKQNFLDKQYFRAKITFLFSDAIVSNSKAGLLAYKAPKRKSYVIGNAFNFNRVNNLVSKENVKIQLKIETNFIIGMLANFTNSKDYKTYFAAAVSLLKDRSDITFVAIGIATDSVDSKALIDSRYIDYFRLLGKRIDIESLINVMDICVLSTFTEGISNSILEYMALEKPVVASIGGGTNEIVVDNETGFLIKPSDPEELAQKLEILLSDADLRMRMGLAGRKQVIDKFSVEKMVKNYINLYRNVLSDKLFNRTSKQYTEFIN
jgi:glycosyltransferase involved in cell wall biosynthesis